MPYRPGNQMTREEMQAAAAAIAGGRPNFGSVGNYFNGSMGSINPSALPDYLRSQLTQTNVDDSGQGVWNFGGTGTEGITDRSGRTGMTQLGDTNGVWDHRYIKDWNQVTYDPDLGLVTPQGNIQAQEDKSMTNFGRGLAAIGLAGVAANAPAFFGAGGEGAAGGFDLGAGGGLDPETWALNSGSNPFAGSGLTGAIEGGPGPDWMNTEGGGWGAGGLDPETMAGQGGMGVAQNGIGPGTWADRLSGMLNNPSSVFSGSGVPASLFGSALGNPMNLLGGAQILGGLLGGRGGSNPSGSNPGGSGAPKGGTGNLPKVERGQYQPNPFTQMQMANPSAIQPRNYRSGR